MRKFLKALSLLLCLCAILTAVCSCGLLKKGNGEDSVSDIGGNGGDIVDDNGYEKDSIDRTLGGREIIILMDTSSHSDIMPGEGSKDAVQNKAYIRSLELKKRLDCSFEVQLAPGEWKGMSDFVAVAEKAGINKVDVICAFSCVPSTLQQNGFLSNLKNLQYPELDKPWWPESVKRWEHDGALYYVANNSSNRVIRAQSVVFANTKMIEQNGLAPLEEKVLNYEWTVDLMLQYAKTVPIDDKIDDDSLFGLSVDDSSRMDQFYYGAGLKMMDRNEDGEIVLSALDESSKSKTTRLISKLGEIAATNGFYINNEGSRQGAAMMVENRTMFLAGYMNLAFSLDDASTYIPLPTPMFEPSEDPRYYTTPHNSYDTWCVPHTAVNKEDSALVIEAFASSDYREMAPYFYDKCLKMRYSESENGVKIFDLIRNSTNVDFGRITSRTMDIMEGPFRTCFFRGNKTEFSMLYESELTTAGKNWQTNLETIVTTFALWKDQ